MARLKKQNKKRKKPITLDEVDFYANNFDFLRFLAATMVIVGHSFALFGSTFDPLGYLTGSIGLGGVALFIFFIISGFLITKSWLDKPNVFAYFKKRILRITPGLFCAVVLSFLVIGPIATSLTLKEYFHQPQTWDYLRNIIFQTRPLIPHVFENNPYSSAMNGSLWSLPIEFWMYIFVAIFGLSGILVKRKFFIPVAILITIFLSWHILTMPAYENMSFLAMSAFQFSRLALFFLLGSFFYLYRKFIILDLRITLMALAAFVLTFRTPFSELMLIFTLPYLVISVAYLPKISVLRNFGKYGDFSYGMYIYAFPIQQTLVYFLKPRINLLEFSLLSFFITLIIGIASWHLIEKQFLKLKKVPIIRPLLGKSIYLTNKIKTQLFPSSPSQD